MGLHYKAIFVVGIKLTPFSEEREKLEKLQEEERKQKAKFRKSIENRISKFVNDAEKTRYQFEAMEKVQRTIV